MTPTETIPHISISIVSHNQAHLVRLLLDDLSRHGNPDGIEVILTRNTPEQFPCVVEDAPYPITVVDNVVSKGFGTNHNTAFLLAKGEWFCVMNPDIRLPENPFPVLLDEMARLSAAAIAPAVLAPSGLIEDSIRHFPSLLALASKMLGLSDGRYPFFAGDETFPADWVGGMFMLFHSDDFRAVGGFDESFFMYYEDVDICARLWNTGRPVLACPKTQVIHDARRTSRNSLRYMKWHATSMARYFLKHGCRPPKSSVTLPRL